VVLTESQRALLAARLRRGRERSPDGMVRRPPDTADLPLSRGQEQLWFLDRFAPGLATYNITCALRLRGPLDAAALHCALDALVARHEALRTRFTTSADGRPVQIVDPPSGAGTVDVDLAHLPAPDRADRVRELAATEGARPFDLAAGPVFRPHLVRLAEDEHVLIVVVHHIVFDGWSVGVLQQDLAALYEAETEGAQPPPEPLPIQFADFALWERERLASPVLSELVAYWRRTLDGFQTLELATDRPRPLVENFHGAVERFDFGADLLADLRELSRREGTTLFVTLLAAFQALLHRYTGQDDIMVGTVSANRSRSQLAPLIGYLVNTLPIRTDVSGDPSFRDLLGRVREATMGAYAHQDLPFADLVEALRVERDPGRSPVFQTTFTHVELAEIGERHGAGVSFGLADGLDDADTAKFDLALFAETGEHGFVLIAAYATALFDPATVRRMLGNLRELLAGVVADPERRIGDLAVLTAEERRHELAVWNETALELAGGCIHERFAAQAARTPDAVAAELDGAEVTYAQLDAQANQVARHLRGLGVVPEVLVGVSMAPSPRRIAVLLGIMKAGGGYVPLDPALPAERLAFMMRDTAMPVLVADDAAAAGPAPAAVRIVALDREGDAIARLDAHDPGYPADPDQTAYVIYTSGSTGVPKGVVVEHRSVVNFGLSLIERCGLGPQDRVLQFASLNFDVSVKDLLAALLSGGRAVLADSATRLSPVRLAALMREREVSFACLPPAVLSLLTGEDLPRLRTLLIGGEEFPADLARAWLRPGLRLFNAYGPTEITVNATLAEVDGSVLPPPIGTPLANQQAYVLDARLNPVPVGVVGELHIGGAGVARGYLNAPDLTATKFISDPFRPGPRARLYRTGDLVRRLPDGRILFVGRADGQVKIRGLRIELGEIETALVAYPGVAQAVAAVAADHAGDKQLVGYLRSETGAAPDLDRLRRHLAERLPGYMVPAHLLTLDAFPLNPNGKVDKAKLPTPGAPAAAPDAYVEPETPTQIALAAVYAALLGRERVGADDGFFALGGNSLRAMQLVSRIHRELKAEVNVAEVFLAPTVRRLAARIDRSRGAGPRIGTGPLVALTESGDGPPLFAVHAIGGTVFGYTPLAADLADRFAVYGIEAAGLAEGTAPAASLDAMAEGYLAALRAAQPTGPYRLAGWSMGGLIAFELARRLEEGGEQVALLALLDAPFTLPGRTGSEAQLAARFAADAARTLGWGAEDPAAYEADQADAGADSDPGGVADRLGRLARRLDAGGGDHAAVLAQVERRFAVFAAHTDLIAGYRPSGALRAETLLVGALRSPNVHALPHWAAILDPHVTTLTVDADHYALLQSPAVREITEQILKWPDVTTG
jgi:amino acid adenylation domain-containing protein